MDNDKGGGGGEGGRGGFSQDLIARFMHTVANLLKARSSGMCWQLPPPL